MGAKRVSLGSEKVDRAQRRGCGLRRGPLARTENRDLSDKTRNSRREPGGLGRIRARLAHTQEALENSRGLHLLPQIQGREKVELLLRDNGRASRFCGSPRAPLGLAHCGLILSPRPRRKLPTQKAGSRSGFGPTASPSQVPPHV